MTENRDTEQEVTLLRREEKPGEHEKSVHGEVRRIDTSLLMGDPRPHAAYKPKLDPIPAELLAAPIIRNMEAWGDLFLHELNYPLVHELRFKDTGYRLCISCFGFFRLMNLRA
jgi:hypothetical protein